ncbi:MAG: hypothetical protein R3351_02935 [Nitrospirales bacterium]|nr:hypothetical protein [Nitrospirales bacterium]
MVENLNIIALVLGVFLSPGLPEGTIEIGKTTCEDAQAVLQTHQLRLVDAEYLDMPDSRSEKLIVRPSRQLVAIHTLSYERAGTMLGVGLGGGNKSSLNNKQPSPRAGFILCGLYTQPIFEEE